ncbi:cytochrome b5 [Nadsonia fulvescens var. elongata DSM 6958]|uniref:Cytochrome b5 n=1 Tax=Nadsonia fulvescens var. elongata DSM 6958 TaxID=857566 RepID=A0A1E3PDZ1_9ASCO|nr:cytochrome b5 [Nadsonia fulvescens var. elongata DSM 6958]
MPSPALRVTPTLSVPAAKARALHTYTSPATPGRTEASQPNIISRTPKLATGTSPASTVRASLRRNKVKLKPGFSALDWSKLRSSGKNLRGVEYPGLIRVTAAELAQHQTKDDAWTALGGKVYNMTHYMGFHPGGERDLMRVAGKDGTKLFMATHSWVSFESMLDGCLVGFYQP